MPTNVQPLSFDPALAAISGLTWLPWVGSNYATLPEGRRVLIVAESHYSHDDDLEKAKQLYEQQKSDQNFTRDVAKESLIDAECETPTFRNMHRLFYGPEDRENFWNQLCFYNFVQELMRFEGGVLTRPKWEDFWKGWEVFVQVVGVLKPDHVLFIGVEAANHFNGFMTRHKHEHVSAEWAEKVGMAYARTACLTIEGTEVPLHFIKHCGSYFSIERWLDYLHREARPLMSAIAASAGATLPEIPTSRLHILGMAKSSLDLRGAKGPKLELDFLRLAYAVRDFREAGEDAIGYLMVLDSSVAETAARWAEKYRTEDAIAVLCCEPGSIDRELLVVEKTNNAIGFLPDLAIRNLDRKLAFAHFGKNLGEESLIKSIEERHPGIIRSYDFPLGIHWDFYGTLNIVN